MYHMHLNAQCEAVTLNHVAEIKSCSSVLSALTSYADLKQNQSKKKFLYLYQLNSHLFFPLVGCDL